SPVPAWRTSPPPSQREPSSATAGPAHWPSSAAVAISRAADSASPSVRWTEAALAASLAAPFTSPWASTSRPAPVRKSRNSRKIGASITVSTAIDPRSRLRSLTAVASSVVGAEAFDRPAGRGGDGERQLREQRDDL